MLILSPTHPPFPPPPPDLPGDHGLTRLLNEVGSGSRPVGDLIARVYDELRRIAGRQMASERADHTLEPTALVNELFLKLSVADNSFQNRAHFFGAAANAMRQILVDSARRKLADKRGGDRAREALAEDALLTNRPPEEIVVVDELMDMLERTDPRKKQILGLWYFIGLTHQSIADLLGVDVRTIGRDVKFLRGFVSGHLGPDA